MASSRQILTLGDLGPIKTGKTPSTKVPEHFGGRIPFVTPRDMDGRKRIVETERYLSEKGARAVGSAVIPAGSIMVSCIGSDMGKVAIAGRECVTNQQINSIVVSEEYASEYVYYDLSQRKSELRSMASGSAQPILNKGHFSQVAIEIPDFPEQRAIAHILGTLDEKIELNRRMNQTLEATARAIFKSWFVDFDPVRAKAEGRTTGLPDDIAALFPDRFGDSELGEIPKGWEINTVEESAEKVACGPFGSSIKVSTFVPEGVPVISGQHLNGIRLLDQANNFITTEHAEKLKNANVYRGDVIFTHAGNIGQVAFIPETSKYDRYVLSQRQFYLRCNREIVSPFYMAHFNIHHHTELWKKHKAKNPAKGYGTMVAGKYWHWYERWVDVVRKHCQDHREVYA